MPKRRFKEQVYEHVARIASAADSPRRLEILEVLAQGPRTVEALAQQTSLSVANASKHLQVLRQAALVEASKRGLFVEYRLAGADVLELTRVLRTLAERRLGDLDRLVRTFAAERDGLEPISREELKRRMPDGLGGARGRQAGRGVPGRAHPGSALDAAGRAAEAASGAAGAERDRRLLSRALLRHGVRRRCIAPSARAARATARRRLPGMAFCGTPRRRRRGTVALTLAGGEW